MSLVVLVSALAASPPLIDAPMLPCPPGETDAIIPAASRAPRNPQAREPLGDVWEMEEVSCWRGTWLRRGRSNIFDAYWKNPDGQRERAVLRIWINGDRVIVGRQQGPGKYCRYDGTLGVDGLSVSGWYSCTWHPSRMQWQGHIVHLPTN